MLLAGKSIVVTGGMAGQLNATTVTVGGGPSQSSVGL